MTQPELFIHCERAIFLTSLQTRKVLFSYQTKLTTVRKQTNNQTKGQ